MIEQWVIDQLNPLARERLIIVADPQWMIRSGAQAVEKRSWKTPILFVATTDLFVRGYVDRGAWRRQRVGKSPMKAERAPGSGKLRSAAATSLKVRTAEAEGSVHLAAGVDVGGQLRRRLELDKSGDATRSLRAAFKRGGVRRDGYLCAPERPVDSKASKFKTCSRRSRRRRWRPGRGSPVPIVHDAVVAYHRLLSEARSRASNAATIPRCGGPRGRARTHAAGHRHAGLAQDFFGLKQMDLHALEYLPHRLQ
jgi:hypothetical protein